MTPIDRSTIQARLQMMAELLSHIDRYVKDGWDCYQADFDRQLAAQHALQLVIEIAIDINNHLLVQSGHAPPEDNYHSFLKVGQLSILPGELAEQLAPSAGLRNRIVHLYEDLDQKLIFQALQDALADYPRYVKEIQAYLERGIGHAS